jgi:multiple sugar transport system ATP-binding protein
MSGVNLDRVTKRFADGTLAVDNITLDIADGEFMVLVGPSGCGKTTLLRLVAGLEKLTAGDIYIGDKLINDVPGKYRDVAMVFQNYALYPHMSVFDNMAFGLKRRRLPRQEVKERVTKTATALGLANYLDKKPAKLSGGQRQRVAMGRAIVRSPEVFLMDEPLSNLDAKLRVQMRAEISRIQRNVRVTTIYVTHDQIEAMTMGDRVAVINGGHVEQVGTPQELYERPCSVFVAGFLGSPPMNLIDCELSRDGVQLALQLGSASLPVSTHDDALAAYVDRRVRVGIRPEHVLEGDRIPAVSQLVRLRATVDLKEVLGPEVYLHLSLMEAGRQEVPSEKTREQAQANGFTADLGLNVARTLIARVDAQCPLAEGTVATVAVDPARLQYFDPDSGECISYAGSATMITGQPQASAASHG